MEQFENNVLMRGTLQSFPQFSHENHGKRFYRFFLEVPRLSGAVDVLPVLAELGVLQTLDLSGGSSLRVEGQIRSHNITDESGRHLLIFIFATKMYAEDGQPSMRSGFQEIFAKRLLTEPLRWEGKSVISCWQSREPSGGRIICHVFFGVQPPSDSVAAAYGIGCPFTAECKAECIQSI